MHIKLLSVAFSAAILTGCGTIAGGGASDGEASKLVASSTGAPLLSGDGGCVRNSNDDHNHDVSNGCGDDAEAKTAEKGEDALMAKKEAMEREIARLEALKAAPPPPPPPPPAPAPVAEVEKVVLSGRALFPYDSAQLTGQGNAEMDTLIEKLKSYDDIELIDVVGHADSRGAADYNQALSERRAETVKNTLQGAFSQVPITASGLGETSPIASNDNAEGRRLNRRVEIRVEALN